MSTEPTPTLTADEVFREGGALAAAHRDFEFRPGQLQMARAVQEIFERGGVLLAEAGTGTGKTLAYLAPALQAGRRVVVSTATRNLQDQIARKDVPFLRDRLGLAFSALVLKGRENYLCRQRFHEFARHAPLLPAETRPEWSAVALWAETTTSGDRAEVPDLPDEVRFWRDISARADTCLGRRCPVYDDCHLVRLRRQAEETQLLIVNHHLLFADLAVRASDFGRVLPDYDCLILDEAHRIEEIATLHFGRRASSARLRELADDARREAERQSADIAAGGDLADMAAVVAAASAVGRRAADLFATYLAAGEGRRRLARLDDEQLHCWTDLRAGLARLESVLGGLPDAEETVAALRRRSLEARDDLDNILTGDDAAFVRWSEVRGRLVSVQASPIDVSQDLRRELFDPLRSTVLTSATLTVDGSFAFLRRRLGLDAAIEARVESPFDYQSQAVLYLPRGLPDPGDETFVERSVPILRDLLEVTGGRAFLLFTSFARLRATREALSGVGDYVLLTQGEAPRVLLLERFARLPRAVLLGTASFWEGVDVPGAALSLVVIDRLPFAVPDDPLLAARLDEIRSEGGEPFEEYQVPDAVLALKQGAGRLIRTRRDRGILCVLDPRLTTRRYGDAFLRSLPPFHTTSDFDAVRAFFHADPPP